MDEELTTYKDDIFKIILKEQNRHTFRSRDTAQTLNNSSNAEFKKDLHSRRTHFHQEELKWKSLEENQTKQKQQIGLT